MHPCPVVTEEHVTRVGALAVEGHSVNRIAKITGWELKTVTRAMRLSPEVRQTREEYKRKKRINGQVEANARHNQRRGAMETIHLYPQPYPPVVEAGECVNGEGRTVKNPAGFLERGGGTRSTGERGPCNMDLESFLKAITGGWLD